jgi:hypothetical protein
MAFLISTSLRQAGAFMQFRVPPSSLAWVSAIWALLGAWVSYTSFSVGDNFMGGAMLLFCVAGTLIWLDVREVAWPLMIWFAIVIVCAILLLVFKGFALRPLTAIVMAGYTIYELNQWRNSD